MAKSKNKRKNGTIKKYVQKDRAGHVISLSKDNSKLVNNIKFKKMMRTQMLSQACESLTADEVQAQIDKGKGNELSYISTKLDENGVPVSGETKSVVISNSDIERLKSIYRYKVRSEKLSQQNLSEVKSDTVGKIVE